MIFGHSYSAERERHISNKALGSAGLSKSCSSFFGLDDNVLFTDSVSTLFQRNSPLLTHVEDRESHNCPRW